MNHNNLKNTFITVIHTTVLSMLFAFTAGQSAQAAEIQISDVPLYLSSSVSPNIFFEVDDSGSMDWEILTKTYWHYCAYYDNNGDDTTDDSSNCGSKVMTGLWNSDANGNDGNFAYIFSNSDNAYSNTCDSGDRSTVESCNSDLTLSDPYLADWRVFSSDVNVVYYNPQVSYTPWNGPCLTDGSNCTDANFTSARSNPRQGESGYTVTKNLTGFVYEVWEDSKGYDTTDGRPGRGSNLNVTNTANGMVDMWDTHKTFTIGAGNIRVTTTTYSPNSDGLQSSTTPPTVLTGSGPHTALGGRTISQVKQNIANWYEYNRKRAYVAKGAIAEVINDNSTFLYGLSFINTTSTFFGIPASGATLSTHNDSILTGLFSLDQPSEGTPLRNGLKNVGEYFSDPDGPVIASCQKNFSVLFTDGYWNGGDPGVGDDDGDGVSNTLADVAKQYRDNTRSQLTTFTVAFGVEGELVDTDNDGWPNPTLTSSGDWGDPTSCSDCPAKIDDLWHAAYNSDGEYVNAATASDVVDALQEVLRSIDRRSSSSASVAMSSSISGTGVNIYQSNFNSADWHGEIRQIPIDLDSTSSTYGRPDFSAAVSMDIPQASNREIITSFDDGNIATDDGIPFLWSEINPTQQALLNKNSAGVTDPAGSERGEDRLNFIRGETIADFRVRENGLLGDLINSSPVYVGAPAFRYSDVLEGAPHLYSKFKNDNKDRAGMIYTGANDGMVHGFDVETHSETIAYVPNVLFKQLSQLPDPRYTHKFYVDGTPTIGDALFGFGSTTTRDWKTVLVGGLNAGGQGIYALDITDPTALDEGSASDIALWEFSDETDADLGFTYSRPAIVRMHNGQWAAVFGNGYNNTLSDGNASTTGNAVLYIVDIETGAIIKKIDTGVGMANDPTTTNRANGLATTAPVDINGDFIIDIIYAGDLFGNMWKFDVSSKTAADWDVAFEETDGTSIPLFTACYGNDCSINSSPQPITTRPEVARAPDGYGTMVFFGTGLYLGNNDVGNRDIQSIYGIIDKDAPITSRTSLQQQTITTQTTTSGIGIRGVSNNPISASAQGCFMDLNTGTGTPTGERVIHEPILRSDRIIFATNEPNTEVCGYGGKGWLMELNARSCGYLPYASLDVNSDGVYDMIDDSTPVSGKGFNQLITTPGILNGGDKEFKYTSGSSGEVEVTDEEIDQSPAGRQSWRQIR